MSAKRNFSIIDEIEGNGDQASVDSDVSDDRLADIEAEIEALKADMAPRTKTKKLRQRIRDVEKSVGDLSEAIRGFVEMINKHDNSLGVDLDTIEDRVNAIEERIAEKDYERPAKRRRIDKRDALIDRLFHRIDNLEEKLRIKGSYDGDLYDNHPSLCKECTLAVSCYPDEEKEHSPEVSEEDNA